MRAIVIFITISCLTGCTMSLSLDRIEDGSQIQTTYRRDRYANYETGIRFARAASNADGEELLEQGAGQIIRRK